VIEIGRRAVRLYPIYHPAAALYTPRMLETLREDFAKLPELLAMGPPEQPVPIEAVPQAAPAVPGPAPEAVPGAATGETPSEADQLGLF
jgi:DNA polymerase